MLATGAENYKHIDPDTHNSKSMFSFQGPGALPKTRNSRADWSAGSARRHMQLAALVHTALSRVSGFGASSGTLSHCRTVSRQRVTQPLNVHIWLDCQRCLLEKPSMEIVQVLPGRDPGVINDMLRHQDSCSSLKKNPFLLRIPPKVMVIVPVLPISHCIPRPS